MGQPPKKRGKKGATEQLSLDKLMRDSRPIRPRRAAQAPGRQGEEEEEARGDLRTHKVGAEPVCFFLLVCVSFFLHAFSFCFACFKTPAPVTLWFSSSVAQRTTEIEGDQLLGL